MTRAVAEYQREFYDKHYARRASILQDQLDHPLFSEFHRRMAGRILSYASPAASPLRLVEQACGEGLLTSALGQVAESRGLDLDYLGADLSPAAVEVAAKALPGGRFEAGEATAHTSGLPPGSADLVVAKNLLHHLDDPVSFLAAVRRALAPGGRLVAAEASRGSIPTWVFSLLAPRRERYWFTRGPRTVRAHFAAAGLSVVAEERFSFLPYELCFVIRPSVLRRALHPGPRGAARVGGADDRLARLLPPLAGYRLWVVEAASKR